ncbi:MAG: hypothetical protein GX678_05265 [Actinomycetales bacterium]|nr:hypothetical protein [Actinomycetales bacterium]
MGLDDLVNKGKELLDENKDKLTGDKVEEISDKVLDAGTDFAKKHAPGHADKIDVARDAADKAIGDN